MADESSGQEKTEEPTARRLHEARQKGDIAKSIEIPSASVLILGLLTIYVLSGYMMNSFKNLIRHYLVNAHTIQLVPDNMQALSMEGFYFVGKITLPVMLAVVIAGLVANYAQFGILFTGEKLKPDITKIDPVQGFIRKFSLQSLAELIKSMLKIGLIGLIAFLEVKKAMPQFLPLMDQEVNQILIFVAKTAFWLFLKCAIMIALLAIFDYIFQRWQFMKKMKMTKQEVKEEAKMTEGDPQVKGRIRSIQMEMARRRMMEEVPKADVVITNPTRLAIALRYDAHTMEAPTVVAKGAGAIAHRIKEIAAEHNVPMVEDKPLAQALFKAVHIGHSVPENLYQAVAEVLAYVYGTRRNRAA